MYRLLFNKNIEINEVDLIVLRLEIYLDQTALQILKFVTR